MNVHLPAYRRLWKKAAKENRELRSERAELILDLAIAKAKAHNATARADALEKANDELRSDLSSWMERVVSSDG